MKKLITISILLFGSQITFGQADATSHFQSFSTWYLGWDNLSTNPLNIRHDNTTSPQNINFWTNGTQKMTILGTNTSSDGYVGIAKIVPSFQLCVGSHISIDTLMVYPTNASPIGCYMLRDSTVLHNNGFRNIFTGVGAGYSLTSGIENTFNGFNAGNLVTTGRQN